MRLIGFTDRRHDVFAGPVYATNEPAKVISVSNISNDVWKYSALFHRGNSAIQIYEPDVLLSNHPGRLGFAVSLLGIRHDLPVVIKLGGDLWRTNHEKLTEHWTDRQYFSLLARWGQIALNRIVCRQAAGFIVVSEALKRTVVERTGRPEDEVQVVHVPVEYERYANGNRRVGRRRINVGNAPLLLTVTNLNFRGKFEGICRTIEELEPILRKHQVTYAVAGDGRYYDRLREYVEKRVSPAIRNRIRLLGFVDSIANVYAAADLFVYLSDIDGYPNAISEAQAAGLPIIANAAYGMIEQIDDGYTGLLVEMSSRGDLRHAVCRLLENPALRMRFGKRAQQTVRERNSPEAIGGQMLHAIKTIVEKRRPGQCDLN